MNTFDNSVPRPNPESAAVSHDTQAPPNLINFMLKGWKKVTKKITAVEHLKSIKGRRENLSKCFPGEVLIIPSGHEKVRSNDTVFRFRPNSDFYYLTGNTEPDCVLVMVPDRADTHRTFLFVEPNPGKTTPTFFTDRAKGELWVGPRLGVPESLKRYGVDEVKPLLELDSTIRSLVSVRPRGCRIVRGFSERVDALVHPSSAEQLERDRLLTQQLHDLRVIKEDCEIKELLSAVKSTKRGFEDVIERLPVASSERELEGVFYTRARTEGNDVGYYSIVASGEHGCILHYTKNDGKLHKNDLLLLDAGIEGNSLYTADVTRTLPIKGKFSKEQKQVYEIVLAAQTAAMKAVKPGNDFMEPNRHAMKVLAQGLYDLGILKCSPEEALRDENQFYKRYSLHNVSHMLGLDVHDCARARMENYKYGKLKPGMVLTVEPGLYFQTDDETVPAKYRGIGIRIEDDVVVTEKGCKNLSESIPSEPEAVEKWIKDIWGKRRKGKG